MPMKKKNPDPIKGTNLKAAQSRYNTSKSEFIKKENQKSIEGQKKDPDYRHDWNKAFQEDYRARKSGLKKPDDEGGARYENKYALFKTTDADRVRRAKYVSENMASKVKTRNVAKKSDGLSGQTLERAQMRKNVDARKAQMNKPTVKSVSAPTRKPVKKKK